MQHPTHIRDDSGQTMVEFTLVLPILCVLLFGILEFGIVWNHYVTLTDAVRAGARKAVVSRALGAGGAVSAAQQAVQDSATDLDKSKLTPINVTSTWQRGDPVTVHAEYPYDISLLNWVIASGHLKSTTTERVE